MSELLSKEDWWAVWLGLGTVRAAVLVFGHLLGNHFDTLIIR